MQLNMMQYWDQITGQYTRTIADLSARLANMAVHLAMREEQNSALTKKVAELEKKLAAEKPAPTAPPPQESLDAR